MDPTDTSYRSEDGRSSEEPRADYPPNGTGKRKGHRKSRGGCWACKRKKIKCQETRPACKNCIRSGIDCQYASKSESSSSASPPSSSSLSISPPTSFSMDDLRSFHHFLLGAYPHLPLGTGEAWVHEVPALAHNFDFLMSAILSLGSCHLDYLSSNRKRSRGWERHRLQAIKGLNDAFSRNPRQGPERDAMLATCYALTFESAYSGDSLAEFLTLVRGCGTMTVQLKTSDQDSVLVPSNSRSHVQIMTERFRNIVLPTIKPEHVQAAVSSLVAVRPLCVDDLEFNLVEAMIATATLCLTSSHNAYFNFIRIYDRLTSMAPEDFARLTDPTNSIGQILQGHFIALEALMSPFLTLEASRPGPPVPGRLSEKSIRLAYDACVPFAQHYLRWPMDFCESIAMTFPYTEEFLCVTEEQLRNGFISEMSYPGTSDIDFWQMGISTASDSTMHSP